MLSRLLTVVAALGLLFGALPTLAATVQFGSLTNNSTCSLAGNGGDRSCTNTGSVNNGALDTTASVNIRGQASADHGLTGNPTAIADIVVSYTVPVTITRTVTVLPADLVGNPDARLVIPNQSITYDLTYNGTSAVDNSQVGGGLGNARSYNATVSSALFGGAVLSGSSRTGGTGQTPFNDGLPDIVGNTPRNYSGPGGIEISATIDIPTDFQDWEDQVDPFIDTYYPTVATPTYVQSIQDTLTISFRLRAESRPSGSISTTGGEAIACAGQGSPLGAFDLNPNCGNGLTVNATVAVTGSTTEVVPEPATLALVATGLAGLVALGVRRRS